MATERAAALRRSAAVESLRREFERLVPESELPEYPMSSRDPKLLSAEQIEWSVKLLRKVRKEGEVSMTDEQSQLLEALESRVTALEEKLAADTPSETESSAAQAEKANAETAGSTVISAEEGASVSENQNGANDRPVDGTVGAAGTENDETTEAREDATGEAQVQAAPSATGGGAPENAESKAPKPKK